MYEDRWNRFAQTGQIEDYLAYKQESGKQLTCCETRDKTGEVRESGYAGFCYSDRYHN